jgi:GAF domain-containing protein
VPIRLAETVTGVLTVDLPTARLGRASQPVLERFASVAALALDNVRRQEHLHAVLSASRAVTAPGTLKQTLKAIMQTVRQVSPDLSALTLWYRDPETGRLCWGDAFGVRSPRSLQTEEPPQNGVVYKVLHASEPIWADHLRQSKLLGQHFARIEGIVSAAAFPLRVEGEPIGAMFFNYRQPHPFTSEERSIFPILVEVVAASLRDVIHLEARVKESRRLDAALKTTDAIGAALDLNQLFNQVLANLRDSFKDTVPCVLTYNEDDGQLVLAPSTRDYYPIDDPRYTGLRSLSLDDHLFISSVACRVARRSLAEKRIVIENVPDVAKDPDYLPAISTTRSELCSSLVSDGRLLGVLVLERPVVNGFEPEDEGLVLAIAQQISLAIERTRQSAELSFKQTVATVTAWAADLAHDFNREIGKIRQSAYLIRERSDSAGEMHRLAADIESSASRLAEASPWMSHREPIPVDTFIRERVEEYVHTRGDKISLAFDLNCQSVSVESNPVFFRRVLRQLVRNAAQAMAKSPEQQLLVSTHLVEGDKVEIQFSDSGPGVDDKVRSLIFQQRISTKRDEGGYGLLLTRQMVEDMGGAIRLLPREAEDLGGGAPRPRPKRPTGATFSIKIPIKLPQALPRLEDEEL